MFQGFTVSHKEVPMKENNKLSAVICVIVSFILSLFITLITYMLATYFGLFNKALLLDAMNKSSFYESVNLYTAKQAEDLAIPAGLDESVFDEVFSEKVTYKEGKAYLISTLNGENYSIDTSFVKKQLTININKFISDQGFGEEDYDQENVDAFVDKICSIYASNLSVPYLSYYKGITDMFTEVILWGIPILAALCILGFLFLIKLNKWFHRALRYIAYSFLAASLMVSLMPAFLISTKKYQYLNISPAYVNRLLSRYIGQSLYTYLYSAFVLLAAGLVIISIIYYKRQKLLQKHKAFS